VTSQRSHDDRWRPVFEAIVVNLTTNDVVAAITKQPSRRLVTHTGITSLAAIILVIMTLIFHLMA
jgi:hypothetical protein